MAHGSLVVKHCGEFAVCEEADYYLGGIGKGGEDTWAHGVVVLVPSLVALLLVRISSFRFFHVECINEAVE